MINQAYSDLCYRQHVLSNIKVKKQSEEHEFIENKKRLLQFELSLTSTDIIESTRDAFKHIPPTK